MLSISYGYLPHRTYLIRGYYMNFQVKQAWGAPKVWLALALFIALIASLGVLFTSEPAGAAAPISNGAGVEIPTPVPTLPIILTPVTPVTAVPTSLTPQPTETPGGIPTPVPTGVPTVEPCYTFEDVQPTDWFYEPVNWMACNHIVGGYDDGTFRPNNPTTRGQTTKMLVGAFGLALHVEGGPHFSDVPADNPFYSFVETASYYGIVGGYPCGGELEPCDAQSRSYFRPNNLVTRSQITKIAVLAAQQANPASWQLVVPGVATFVDVPTSNTFFPYVETAVANGIIGGYECGGSGEPCPGRYFRPQADATRAQISKITFMAALLP
jgi:hypothetical protein